MAEVTENPVGPQESKELKDPKELKESRPMVSQENEETEDYEWLECCYSCPGSFWCMAICVWCSETFKMIKHGDIRGACIMPFLGISLVCRRFWYGHWNFDNKDRTVYRGSFCCIPRKFICCCGRYEPE